MINSGGSFIQLAGIGDPSKLASGANVLFEPGSPDVYSKAIIVIGGRSVIIRAYGLQRDDSITIESVVVGTSDAPNSQAALNRDLSGELHPLAVLHSEQVKTKEGVWQITHDLNTGVINMPGTYRLVASSFDMLDYLHVEYIETTANVNAHGQSFAQKVEVTDAD